MTSSFDKVWCDRPGSADEAGATADTELLHSISVALISEDRIEILYEKIMDAAVAIMRSQYASMQMLYSERGKPGSGGELRLLAFRGFNPEAAKFWEWVRADSESTCGMALRTGKRSIASDVETCDFMAGSEDLATYLQTGIRSVQTTPLISRSGKLLGMISTHWSEPHQPSQRDLNLLDILARQAADLLERTQAEEALRARERQLDGMLGAITDAFMSFDATFHFTFVNEHCERRMGRTRSELIGRNLWELFPDALGNTAHAELNRAMAERIAVEYEVFYEPWKRWFCDKAYPTGDGGLAVYSTDITERKHAEQALRVSEERVGADLRAMTRLQALGNLCSRAESPLQPCLEALLDACIELSGADKGNIQLFDTASGVLKIAAQRGFDRPFLDFFAAVTPADAAACGAAMQNGERIVVEDITRSDLFAGQPSLAVLLDAGVRAVQSTPLRSSAGRMLGMISTHCAGQHEFGERELRLVDLIARQAADFLERHHAEQALRENERQFRETIDALPAAIYTTDAHGRLTHFNSAAVQLSGRVPERGSDKWCVSWKLYRPDGTALPHDECPMAIALKEGRAVRGAEAIAERPDGTRVWFAPYPTPLLDAEGKVAGGVNMLVDITERKRAEEALRESEERFRMLADNMNQLAWTCDKLGDVTWYNQRWLDYTGLTFEEMKDWGWKRVQDPDHVDRVVTSVTRSRESGEPWEDTFPLRGKDGKYRWFLSRAVPIRNDAGEIVRWFGTNTDITERRQAEETQRMLTGELSHRVKNMLATVQAIATQTLRHNGDPAQFVSSFGGRIQSMSRVHALLSSGDWQGADLRDVIRDQLLLGPIDETRVTAWGPAVHLEAQLTPHVAMMLHELGTNSIKYGALSKADGIVTISWAVSDEMLVLRWAERGGPQVKAPARRGFGTTLVKQSAEGIGGKANITLQSEGVHWEIALPLPRPKAANGSLEPVARSELIKATHSPAARNSDSAPPVLAGKRFLVVEDEPLVALDVVASLMQAGVEVAGQVGNAKDALALIERTLLDAAVLDANLHGQPVDDVAAALTRKNVPFIFVTGYGRDGLPPAFAQTALLSKPFSQQQLMEAAARLVQKPAAVVKLRG